MNRRVRKGAGKLIRLKRRWEGVPAPMSQAMFETFLAEGYTPAGEVDLTIPLTAREKLDPNTPPGATAKMAPFIYFYRDEPEDDAQEEAQS